MLNLFHLEYQVIPLQLKSEFCRLEMLNYLSKLPGIYAVKMSIISYSIAVN